MGGWDRRRIVTVAALVVSTVIAGVAVFRVPLQSFLVLGIALVCPLLMIGMHAGGDGMQHGSAAPNGSAPLADRDPDQAKEAKR